VNGTRDDAPRVEEELAFYRFFIPVERSARGEESEPTIELRLK
jgi:hypothetical protein